MIRLNNQELKNIRGGFGFGIAAGIVAFAIFVVGVFDGIARPLKCN